jgi:hypothetical protein
MKFKRYNIKELLQNPSIKRDWICKGTVACMAREGVDVTLDEVYDMYDKFTINKIVMPDGYSFNKENK